MPESFSLVTLAGRYARECARTIVVIEIENAGGGQNVERAFPSLDERQIDMLDTGPLVLSDEDQAEAQAAFNAYTDEALAGYETTGSIVTATVTYVGEIRGTRMVTSNMAGFNGYANVHVFEDGTIVNETRV
jgi:hypothetical protein